LEHRISVKRFVSLQFLNLRQLVGLLGRGISPSQGRYLTQTPMPWVGFEPTIPAFERANTFHVTERAAIVIGNLAILQKSVVIFTPWLLYSGEELSVFSGQRAEWTPESVWPWWLRDITIPAGKQISVSQSVAQSLY
jgi:hypothetical protein